jgi:DNA-binding response OmpR family regulator
LSAGRQEEYAMGARIMVINDTPEILDLFRELLEPKGYDVVIYSYAPFELAEIERIQPDLIVLDLIIGHANAAWQLLQMLKMRRTTATIPVIICTAQTIFVRQIEGYLAAHNIRVMPKPFDIDDFLQAIMQIFADEKSVARHQPTAPQRKDESSRSDGTHGTDEAGSDTPRRIR